MNNNLKRIPGSVIGIGIAVVIALLIWIFVDVSIESVIRNASGSCISVAFDKPILKGADRIVVYEGKQVITITDKEAVRRIADMFTVANRTGLCDHSSGWRLEIYNGQRLVRRVTENCDGRLYHIYDQDLLHWVLPSEDKNGQVELSQEEYLRLTGIIEQYR